MLYINSLIARNYHYLNFYNSNESDCDSIKALKISLFLQMKWFSKKRVNQFRIVTNIHHMIIVFTYKLHLTLNKLF